MGQEIFYCFNCQTQLRTADFERGTAFRVEARVVCSKCSKSVLEILPPEKVQDLLKAAATPPEAGRVPASPSIRSSTTAIPHIHVSRSDGTEKSTLTLVIVGTGIVGVALLVLFTAAGTQQSERTTPAERSSAPAVEFPTRRNPDPPSLPALPSPSSAAAPASSPRSDASVARAETSAREALAQARQYATSHPLDLDRQAELFRRALWTAEGTAAFDEAHSGYEQCLNRMSERTDAAMAPLDAQVREACAKEEFRRALDLLVAARKLEDSSGWNQALEKRSRKTREVASKLLDELKEKARAAAGRKDQPEIALLRSRLIPWGDPEWLASFDAALVAAAPGAPPPPAPNAPAPGPSPAGAKPPPASWLRAMSLATARDYRAAAEELRPTSSVRPPDGTAEPDLAKDLDDLRMVSLYLQESHEALSKWPKGQKITLEFRNEQGRVEKILDSFLRTEGGRIELKGNEGSRLIPLGEVTAASLVHLEISRTQNPKERARAAMLLCLLEGDPEGARALGGDASSIPQKYWTYAQSVLEADGGADPESARKEQEARHAFFQAEAAYGDPRRGIDAVSLYKSLLEAHGETRFVGRNRAAIAARTGPIKEYFFPSTELSGAGAFQWVSPSKGRSCWISQKDGDPAKAQQNYVEAAFSAFPDLEYRCWAYVGGCCAETFECFYQATDLSGPPPKNSKEPVSLEPGSSMFAPVKHSISLLKRTHAQHGGPKMPLRWEWVTILLPKFTAPGLKSIRLLSSQQGFAVSCVLVSAVRHSPLREAELKDLEKAASDRSGASPGLAQNASQDPSLLGYWAFDEKAGRVAGDSTRNHNHGSLQNGAAWASGKVGGGLSLDGNAAFVRVPPSPTLTGLRDQLTVAAWVFRKSDQNGWRFVLTKPKQPESDEEFWLGFFQNRPSFGVDTPSGNKELLGPTAVPLNQWIHLAGTYDGKMLKVFVNGSMLAQEPCAAPLRISSQPLSIGARINVKTEAAGFAFSGLIDEVRLYNRALSAQDVATLAATSTEQHRAAPH